MRECFAIALFSPELNIFSCREAADSRTLPPGGWGQSLVGADHQEGICNILKNYFFKNQESILQKYCFITTKNVFQVCSLEKICSTPLQYLSSQVYWPPAASGHTARLDSAASSHTDRGGNQHLHCCDRLII